MCESGISPKDNRQRNLLIFTLKDKGTTLKINFEFSFRKKILDMGRLLHLTDKASHYEDLSVLMTSRCYQHSSENAMEFLSIICSDGLMEFLTNLLNTAT